MFDRKLTIDEHHKFIDINYGGVNGNAAFNLSPETTSQLLIVPLIKHTRRNFLKGEKGEEVLDDAEIILYKKERDLVHEKVLQRGHYSDFKNGVELRPFDLSHSDAIVVYVKDKKGNDIHLSDLRLKIEADLHTKKQDSIGNAFGLR